LARVSRGFEAESADEGIEVIDDALVEAIELRSLLLVDSSIRADGAEKGSGERRILARERVGQPLGRPRTSCVPKQVTWSLG
jgi:hypothetical protein